MFHHAKNDVAVSDLKMEVMAWEVLGLL